MKDDLSQSMDLYRQARQRLTMQLVPGRTGQEFNQRKNRKGAFWERDRKGEKGSRNMHDIFGKGGIN
jgi:hypothetical protein